MQPGRYATGEPLPADNRDHRGRAGRRAPRQTYYFDDAGLLRRLDYAVDILGGGPAVHYPSQYREFDGSWSPPGACVCHLLRKR
jgi:hypothetical protein